MEKYSAGGLGWVLAVAFVIPEAWGVACPPGGENSQVTAQDSLLQACPLVCVGGYNKESIQAFEANSNSLKTNTKAAMKKGGFPTPSDELISVPKELFTRRNRDTLETCALVPVLKEKPIKTPGTPPEQLPRKPELPKEPIKTSTLLTEQLPRKPEPPIKRIKKPELPPSLIVPLRIVASESLQAELASRLILDPARWRIVREVTPNEVVIEAKLKKEDKIISFSVTHGNKSLFEDCEFGPWSFSEAKMVEDGLSYCQIVSNLKNSSIIAER
ncbi:MAG: hypothetical protein HQL56_17205 [Magnetococcales bacterium]|nr:hypothetical protein [Magnetococcales bacterium]